MQKPAQWLKAGDTIDLGLGPVTIRRVEHKRHVLTGTPLVTVYREPDGKHEATYEAHERVEVT